MCTSARGPGELARLHSGGSSLVNNGAVFVQSRGHALRAVGMSLLGVLDELHADPRCVGDEKVAVFQLQGAPDDLALGRLVLASRVFLQERNSGCTRPVECRPRCSRG